MTWIKFFSETALKNYHAFGKNYFVKKIFFRSFASTIKLASCLSVGVLSPKNRNFKSL